MRLAIGTVVFFLVACIVIDAYIFVNMRQMIKSKLRKLALIAHSLISTVCWIGVVCILLHPVRKESTAIFNVMYLLYTLFTIYTPKIIYVVFSLLGRLSSLFSREKNRVRRIFNIVGSIPAVLIFVLMWVGVFYTRNQIEVNEVSISSDKLPQNFEGYRVVQFSDLHLGTWGNDTTFVSKLVDEINAQNPDLILFTGDIVNRETSEMLPFIDVLSRLKAKDGVYSIMGNHDYGDYVDWENEKDRDVNFYRLNKYQEDMGWKVLKDEHDFITKGSDSIVLIGVENWGEPPFHRYGNLTKAYATCKDSVYNLNDNRFKILLTHNPEHWRMEARNISNANLTLAGHTHAMQMMLKIGGWKWSPSKYKYENWAGLYDYINSSGEKLELYVNIGVGEVGIPARLGSAYPEITIFTLHRENSSDK